jgi:hypothetical protein
MQEGVIRMMTHENGLYGRSLSLDIPVKPTLAQVQAIRQVAQSMGLTRPGNEDMFRWALGQPDDAKAAAGSGWREFAQALKTTFPEDETLQRMIGQAQAGFAIRGASAAAGGVTGYQTTPEDASPQERVVRTAAGALVGGLMGQHFLTSGRKQPAQLALGGGGARKPPGPGGPGQSSLDDIFDMFERNRRVMNPPFTEKARDRLADLPLQIERQITDRYVDLNRLGRNVETAASTYLGRVPGAQWRVKREFQPIYDLIGNRTASNGQSMVDNLNAFIKLQRDREVALAMSPLVQQPARAATTGRRVLRGQPVVGVGPSGLRQSSAGVTGAADADRLLQELQDTLSPEEWDKILTADKMRQQVLDAALDERTQSGLISNEARQWLLATYPHYNPTVMMQNVDEALIKSGGTRNMNVFTNNMRKLQSQGIKTDTEAPMLSAIRGRMRWDIDVRRNDTIRTVVDELRAQGNLGKIRRANATTRLNPSKQIMWYEQGNRMIADLPAEMEPVARAVSALDDTSLGIWNRIFQALNTPLRYGAVVYSPPFWLANAAADYITTFVREGGSTAAKVPKMWLEATREGPLMQAYMEAGGGMSAISQAGTHMDVEKLIRESGGLFVDNLSAWQKATRALGMPFHFVHRVGEVIEMAPRLAAFEATLERTAPGIKGVTTKLAPPGTSPYRTQMMAEAAMAGRRVTIDFARTGNAIKLANPLVLFLNARVQGTMQPFRTLRDKPNAKYRLAALLAPFIVVEAHNRVAFPEEYADIPDWEKKSHAVVIIGKGEPDPQRPGSFKNIPRISIPLREWSAFLAPFKFTMDEYFDKNKPDDILNIAARGAVTAFSTAQNMTPVSGETAVSSIGGLIPAPARTGLELQLNEKFFTGAPIEPETMRNLPPSEKFTERTTAPAFGASELTRKIGSTLSPAQWDFIFQENLAGLGRFLTGDRLNPLNSIFRTSGGQKQQNLYKQLDSEIKGMREQVANATRSSPQYQNATRDQQERMLRQDQLALEEQLKDRYGIDPGEKDYGLPGKYRGVSDRAQEKKIDEAIAEYQEWLADRNRRPSERVGIERPSAEVVRLAARYSPTRMAEPTRTRELRVRRIEAESRSREIARMLAR